MSDQHTDNTAQCIHESVPQLYQQHWNSETRCWQQLPNKVYRNQVVTGIKIAKTQESADILKLPVAAVECVASTTNKAAC